MFRQSRVILASLGMLCVALAMAKDRKTPEAGPHLGAIGVTIQTKGPIAIAPRRYADTAYFVRTDLGEDPFHSSNVLTANFSEKNQVYLLNATPGKYVIQASAIGYTTLTSSIDVKPLETVEVQFETGAETFKLPDLEVEVLDVGRRHAVTPPSAWRVPGGPRGLQRA